MDDQAIAEAILTLCMERGVSKTICPSEAARRLAGDHGDWRALMPKVRAVVGRLQKDGQIAVTQRGVAVEADTAKGAIRLGLPKVQRATDLARPVRLHRSEQ